MKIDDQRLVRTALPALFLLSGAAGLVYQVVWMRMLIRVFGITVYATSTIVAAFMAGLALGSYVFGRLTLRKGRYLLWYGAVEVAVGLTAILATHFMERLPGLYAALEGGTHAAPTYEAVLRLALSFAVLLPPTILMGATFPVLSRVLTRFGNPAGWSVSVLYGLNTLGAMAGVFLTGFLLMDFLGETATVGLAAFVNLLIGGVALAIGRREPPPASEHARSGGGPAPALPSPCVQRAVIAFFAVSGFFALAYEVLWTRNLVLIAGSSVYAFSTMLGTYLAGIGIGSLVVARRLDRVQRPVALFGALQAALAATVCASTAVYGALGLSASSPRYLYSPLNSTGDILSILLHAAIVILPVTVILGVMFPLVIRIVTPSGSRVGHGTGLVYAINTLGGVAGAVATGFVLIPELGTHVTFMIGACVSLVGGLAFLRIDGPFRISRATTIVTAASAALALSLVAAFPSDPVPRILEQRLQRKAPGGKMLFHREGAAATVTGYRVPEVTDALLINGIIVSSKGEVGGLMAHIPLVLMKAPKRALVICFGAGNTFRASIDHGMRTDVAELVPGILDSFAVLYDDADRYLNAPGTRLFAEDGRNFLLMSRERYDLIIVDGSPPIFASGTVNLYTVEFVRLCKKHLTENGIFALWLPSPSFESDFWMVVHGFTRVFEHVNFWAHRKTRGTLIMGSRKDIGSDPKTIRERIEARALDRKVPWFKPKFVAKGMLAGEARVRAKAASYPLVTDDRPRTEYPLFRFLAGERFFDKHSFLFGRW